MGIKTTNWDINELFLQFIKWLEQSQRIFEIWVNNTYSDNMSQQNFSIAYFSTKHKKPIVSILYEKRKVYDRL